MACKIILDKDPNTLKTIPGHIKAVKAPNGKRSFLFDGIRDVVKNDYKSTRLEEDALSLEKYYLTQSDSFKNWFGDSTNLDSNNEPAIDENGVISNGEDSILLMDDDVDLSPMDNEGGIDLNAINSALEGLDLENSAEPELEPETAAEEKLEESKEVNKELKSEEVLKQTPTAQIVKENNENYQIDLDHFEFYNTKYGYSDQQLDVLKRYNNNIIELIKNGVTKTGIEIKDGKIEVKISSLQLPYNVKKELEKRGNDTVTLYASTNDKGYVTYRVTMKQDVNFLKGKTKEQIEKLENTSFSDVSKSMGTKMHRMNELVLEELMSNDSDTFDVPYGNDMLSNFSVWNDSDKKTDEFMYDSYTDEDGETKRTKSASYLKLEKYARDNNIFDPETQSKYIKKMVRSMLNKWHSVQSTQNRINRDKNSKIKNPNNHVYHKPIILLEKPFYDKGADEAGTIDMLVLYSDGTAGVYDHKFTNLGLEKINDKDTGLKKSELKQLKKQQGLTGKNFVYMFPGVSKKKMQSKEESWNLQLGRYAQMLKELYGVKNIRHARILPVQVTYTKHKVGVDENGKDKLDYDLEKSRVAYLNTGTDMFGLTEIPMQVESQGKDGDQLSQFINKLIGEKKKLMQERLDKKAFNDTEINNAIDTLDLTIKKLQTTGDIKTIVDYIEVLNNNIQSTLDRTADIDSDETAVFGEYVNYLNQSQLYGSFINAVSSEIEDMKRKEESLIALGEEIKQEDSFAHFKNRLSGAITQLKLLESQIQDAMTLKMSQYVQSNNLMSEKMFNSFMSQTDMTMVGVFQTHLRESKHPLVSLFSQLLDKVNTNRIQEVNAIKEQLLKHDTKLQEWGGKKGLKGVDIYKGIINNKGDLIGKFSKEYYEELNMLANTEGLKASEIKARKDRMKEMYQRNEAGEKYFQARYEKTKVFYQKELDKKIDQLKYEDLTEKELKKKTSDLKKQYTRNINNWLKENDITHKKGNNNAWFNSFNKWMLEPKNNEESYYNDKYKELNKPENKPLKDYYDFYKKLLTTLNDQVDFRVSSNFIPEIRKSFLDTISQDGLMLSGMTQQYKNMWNHFTKHDTDQGFQGVEDGKKIPIMFMDSVGRDNKSYDLSKSILMFSDFVYNYKGVKDIEGMSLSIKYLIENTPGIKKDFLGDKVRIDGVLQTNDGNVNTVKAINSWIDYYIYNKKSASEGDKNALGNKVVNTLLSAGSRSNVALNVLSATSGHINAEANLTMLATKGSIDSLPQARKEVNNFKNLLKKSKDNVENYSSPLAFASEYFELSQDNKVYEKANEVSINSLNKKFKQDYAYVLQRWSDDAIDNTMLTAMMMDYGIDPKTGRTYPIKRLKTLYKDDPKYGGDFEWKSLWESVDMENVIDGEKKPIIRSQHTNEMISKSTYTDFRRKARHNATKTKGNMSDDDIAGYKRHVLGRLLMQYKGWLPAMARERIKNEEYNMTMEEFEVGRWIAWLKGIDKLSGKSWKSLTKLVMPFVKDDLQVMDGPRMKQLYAKFIADNPQLEYDPENPSPDQVSYEDYMNGYKGQIRALAKEIQLFLALLAVSSMWDFGWGEDNIKQNRFLGISSQLFDRAMLELGFFTPIVGWSETLNMLRRGPVPATGVIDKALKTIGNTADEVIDVLSGQSWDRTYDFKYGDGPFSFKVEDKKDKKTIGYYSLEWLPGGKTFRDFTGILDTRDNVDNIYDWISSPHNSQYIYK